MAKMEKINFLSDLYVADNKVLTEDDIPTPSSSNNGQILGVVNGKLEYIDIPASGNLANVSEASF